MQILSEGTRKANKNHTCNYCGGKIEKGEQYFYQNIKDSDIYTWRSHEHCEWLVGKLDMGKICDGMIDEMSFCEIINDEFYHTISTAEKSKILYDKLKNPDLQ